MDDKDRLLEIYKLHADLIDRVSQRRATANQLHTGILVGLVALLGLMFRVNPDADISIYLMVAGLFGVAVCVAWLFTIKSYRQLNTIKFAAMDKLEPMLPFQFFAEEWRKEKEYHRLTIVETLLPYVFGLLFLAFAIYGLVSKFCFKG